MTVDLHALAATELVDAQKISSASPAIRKAALAAAAFDQAVADVLQPVSPPAPTPTPVPTSVPVNIYVNPSGSSGLSYAMEWDKIVAAGLHCTAGIMAPLDAATVTHVGAHGQWCLIYNGCSQSDFVKYGVPCWNTGLVKGFVVWDEPGGDAASIAAVKTVASWVKANCPGALTATTGYAAQTLASLAAAKVTDLYLVDAYPSRTGWDLAVERACVAALEQASARYGIVLDAFTAPNYPIPTGPQLQSEIDWAKSTKAELLSIYAWGVSGGSPKLQDDLELMQVLRSL